jgi:hypothetical protein
MPPLLKLILLCVDDRRYHYRHHVSQVDCQHVLSLTHLK